MKHFMLFVAALAMLSPFTSCAEKAKQTPDAKSPTTATAGQPAQDAAATATVSITPEGIGPVTPGATFSSLPASVPGLYDKINLSEEEMEDMGEVIKTTKATFTLKGKEQFNATGDADGIWCIALVSKDIKVTIGDHKVGLGDDFEKVKGAKGLTVPSEMGYAAECGNFYLNTDTNNKVCSVQWGTMM